MVQNIPSGEGNRVFEKKKILNSRRYRKKLFVNEKFPTASGTTRILFVSSPTGQKFFKILTLKKKNLPRPLLKNKEKYRFHENIDLDIYLNAIHRVRKQK